MSTAPYRLQARDFNGRWADLTGMARKTHATQSAAWEQARSYDEDGLITSTYRVVDATGKVTPRPGSLDWARSLEA